MFIQVTVWQKLHTSQCRCMQWTHRGARVMYAHTQKQQQQQYKQKKHKQHVVVPESDCVVAQLPVAIVPARSLFRWWATLCSKHRLRWENTRMQTHTHTHTLTHTLPADACKKDRRNTFRLKDGKQTQVSCLGSHQRRRCCRGWGRAELQRWSGSSNTLLSLVQKAIWARLWPLLAQSAFCVAALHWLLRPQSVFLCWMCSVVYCGQIWIVYLITCPSGERKHIFFSLCVSVYLNVCVRVKCVIPLQMHAHKHARAHAGCHFLYLGESECGSQSTYTLLGNVWTATPPPHGSNIPRPAPWLSTLFHSPEDKLREITFLVPFSKIQQLNQVQSFLFTGNSADVTRRMFVFQLQFCRCFKAVVHKVIHEHNRGKKGR